MKAKKCFGSKRGILVKGKWKPVELDPSIFANETMGEMVCFEELTDYSLVDTKNTAAMAGLLQDITPKKQRKNKRKASEIETEEQIFEKEQEEAIQLSSKEKTKKRKKKKEEQESDEFTYDDDDDDDEAVDLLDEQEESQELQDSDNCTEFVAETAQKTKKKKKNKKKKKQKPAEKTESDAQVLAANDIKVSSKRKAKNWTNATLSKSAGQETDVSAWKDLYVPEPVLKALSKLGFSAPTPIQALALPPAIRDHLDILGAAETGNVTSTYEKIYSFHYPFSVTKKIFRCEGT